MTRAKIVEKLNVLKKEVAELELELTKHKDVAIGDILISHTETRVLVLPTSYARHSSEQRFMLVSSFLNPYSDGFSFGRTSGLSQEELNAYLDNGWTVERNIIKDIQKIIDHPNAKAR